MFVCIHSSLSRDAGRARGIKKKGGGQHCMMRAKESRSQVRQPCPSLSSRLFGGGVPETADGG